MLLHCLVTLNTLFSHCINGVSYFLLLSAYDIYVWISVIKLLLISSIKIQSRGNGDTNQPQIVDMGD